MAVTRKDAVDDVRKALEIIRASTGHPFEGVCPRCKRVIVGGQEWFDHVMLLWEPGPCGPRLVREPQGGGLCARPG